MFEVERASARQTAPVAMVSIVRDHDRFGVVVRKWVIQPGLDDPFVGFGGCPWEARPHALFPQAEVAEDTLDDLALIDEYHDAHVFEHATGARFGTDP